MGTGCHHANDSGKSRKVAGFGRSEWVCFKKRDDATDQITKTSNAVAPDVFTMVVVPAVHRHLPAPEELFESGKYRCASLSLDDRELRLDLPTQATRSVLEDRDAEASLAVDEADDPLRS